MSRPVPSPSMNGMIGLFGTVSLPFAIVILAPPAGGVRVGSDMEFSGSYSFAGEVGQRVGRYCSAGARGEGRGKNKSQTSPNLLARPIRVRAALLFPRPSSLA